MSSPKPDEMVANVEKTTECMKCEKWRDQLLSRSPLIYFLNQHIALLPQKSPSHSNQILASPSENASTSAAQLVSSTEPSNPSPLSPVHIYCVECPSNTAGGYSTRFGHIMLCQNRLKNKQHMEDTLAHELVHAFDDRRFNVQWDELKGDVGLRALACSEIRAANLSGDCRWSREVNRLFFGFLKQQQVCVRRRAILSIKDNPLCKSEEHAARIVNEVFDSCFHDTRPFDEIYPA